MSAFWMNRKVLTVLAALMACAMAFSGCLPGYVPGKQTSGDQAATQQAFIVEAVQATATTMAMQTQIAQLQTQVAQANSGQKPLATQAAGPTAVAGDNIEKKVTPAPTQAVKLPTATTTPTQTPLPTATLTATATMVPPTATSVPNTPTPTVTAIPCNAAHFEADVTVPDGAVMSPGAIFTKTWRLKNVGACTWTTSYDLVFVNGDKMSAPSAVELPGNVATGQVIDISVTMTAPTSVGHYRGNWKLRDAAGVLFGVGASGVSIFADIKVTEPISTTRLDFISRMCEAQWTSGAGSLPCPGADNDARGFMFRVDNPRLESGYQDDEPVLLMHPQMVTDGVIRGKYPAFHVESGMHFYAIIGCAYNTAGCDVNFQIDYQISGGSIQNLKTWHEAYDEKFSTVDVDLSGLAGKDVTFILTVFANGSSSKDRAQWLAPHIQKP